MESEKNKEKLNVYNVPGIEEPNQNIKLREKTPNWTTKFHPPYTILNFVLALRGFISDCSPLVNFPFASRRLRKKIMTAHHDKSVYHLAKTRRNISQAQKVTNCTHQGNVVKDSDTIPLLSWYVSVSARRFLLECSHSHFEFARTCLTHKKKTV